MKNCTVKDITARIKQEIIADVKSGRVPLFVRAFQEVLSHAQPTSYGGLYGFGGQKLMLEFFGLQANSNISEDLTDRIGEARSVIDDWLVSGGLIWAMIECSEKANSLLLGTYLIAHMINVDNLLWNHPEVTQGNSKVHFVVHQNRVLLKRLI